MSIAITLSRTIENNHPEFPQLPKKQQLQIMRNVLRTSVKLSLSKIVLPPPKNPIKREIERRQYNRASDHFKARHRPPNHALYDKIISLRTKFIFNSATTYISERISEHSLDTDYKYVSSETTVPAESQYGYDNFLENKQRENTPFFKTELFDFTKSTPLQIKNEITKYKYKLNKSEKIILNVEVNKGHNVELSNISKSNSAMRGSFTESLFLLYDVNAFVQFVKQFQKDMDKTGIHNEQLEYSYDVLRQFYLDLLLDYGMNVEKPRDLTRLLLNDDEFLSLSVDNPLRQGLSLLISGSINFEQMLSLIDKFDI